VDNLWVQWDQEVIHRAVVVDGRFFPADAIQSFARQVGAWSKYGQDRLGGGARTWFLERVAPGGRFPHIQDLPDLADAAQNLNAGAMKRRSGPPKTVSNGEKPERPKKPKRSKKKNRKEWKGLAGC